MCGLAGSYNVSIDVMSMLKKISHRGMDGVGIKKDGLMTHGHVRLSLLDHSESSSQPFYESNKILSFNGEIWNYKEIKKELSEQGYTFKTTGDTEVLFNMLSLYGAESLNKIDGMFSFAWSNGSDCILVRDRFGEIPLYVAKYKTGYIWASERKAFPQKVIPMAVPPGYMFNLKTGKWAKWYDVPVATNFSSLNLISQLKKGVKDRLNSDSPVCCLISGGLDSSLILKIASEYNKNITAFTAKFHGKSNDLVSARRLCSELNIKLIEVDVDINIDSIIKAAECIEINSKAQIEIAAMCIPLAKRIRAEGFKSCLSGEAADELFGGYGNFCIQSSKTANKDIHLLRKKLLAKMSRGNFVRCNKSFMAGGVECRLPFMDLRLVEWAINLDKIQSPLAKKLLKTNANNIVPDWVISRQKDTFQGGSGVSAWTEKNIANPIKFYNSLLKTSFGYLPKD